MKRIGLLLGIFLTGAILFACAPKAAPVTHVEEKPAEIAVSAAKEGWEKEWEKVLKEAKKEGQVILASGFDPDTHAAISKAIKEKFSLKVAWVYGRGAEMAEKVLRERRAGIYSYDISLSGYDTSVTRLKPAGILISMTPLLLLPEVLDVKGWFGNELPFIEKDKLILRFLSYPSENVAINTKLVKKDDIKVYRDLLHPRWKGKILMEDPTISGSALRWAVMIGEYFPELGWDFQRELARQEPNVQRDMRLMAEWLAHGKYSISVGRSTEHRRMTDAGAPVDIIVTKDGNYGASAYGNMAIFDKAPHPWAAQVFINWVLSREGQTIISRARVKQSARIDVPIDHLAPEWTRESIFKAGGTFIFPDDEEFLQVQEKSLNKVKEIWSPLVGR